MYNDFVKFGDKTALFSTLVSKLNSITFLQHFHITLQSFETKER